MVAQSRCESTTRARRKWHSLAARVRNDAGRLDVLVNSIWGADPQIDWGRRFWEVDLAQIRAYLDQTLISHVITSRHIVPLMVEANRGLIVEVIDGHFAGYRGHILYDLVKSSLSRLSYGMAMELAQTGVTALCLSPGFLRSEAVLDHFGVREDNWRDAVEKDPFFAESESPHLVGRAVVALAADPDVGRRAGLIHFAADLAREYGFTDIDGRLPDFPRLFDAKVNEIVSTPPMDDEGRFLVWARYCQIHQDPDRRELAVRLAKALGLETLGAGVAPAAARERARAANVHDLPEPAARRRLGKRLTRLVVPGTITATHRNRRGARPARREEREYP